MAPANSPGLGSEYEILIPCLFVLRLLCFANGIRNFEIRSNADKMGKMDDVVIRIWMGNGAMRNFAFQLKHRIKGAIEGSNLEEKHGDFSLEMYCKHYMNMKKWKDEYYYILYTTKDFNFRNFRESLFKIRQVDDCLGRDWFNTNNGKNFRFSTNDSQYKDPTKSDYDRFFARFSLYGAQANVEQIDEEISTIFKNQLKSNGSIPINFINIFRQWHKKEFSRSELTKTTIETLLVDLQLTPHRIITPCSNNTSTKFALFESIAREFDVTIIEDLRPKFIQTHFHRKLHEEDLVKLAQDNKFIGKKNIEKLDTELEEKVCSFCIDKLIFIDCKDINKDLIRATLQFCKSTGIKLILIGLNVIDRELSPWSVYDNISEVDFKNVEGILDVEVSFQGRKTTTLRQLVGGSSDIAQCITPKELLLLCNGGFCIGGVKEVMPEHYVPRKLSSKLITTTSLKFIETDNLVIIYSRVNSCSRLLKILSSSFAEMYCFKNYIMIKCRRSNDYSVESVHYFKNIDDMNLQWLCTKGSVEQLKKCHFQKKLVIEEKMSHEYFKNNVNVICSRPGMGKSTMLKYLRNEFPIHFWTVHISLTDHNSFLSTANNSTIDEIVDNFLNADCQDNISKEVLRFFKEKRMITFMLDGIDEMQSDCIGITIDVVNKLASAGFKIWLSSRNNLQDILKENLNVCSTIDIDEFEEEEQKQYVRDRLIQAEWQRDISKTVKDLFKKMEIRGINNNILGIPLQLYMITEVLIHHPKKYEELENITTLTCMYRYFMEHKWIHYFSKNKFNNVDPLSKMMDPIKSARWHQYELAALKSCFDPVFFKTFGLTFDYQKFLDKENYDFLGIIMHVDKKGICRFSHTTYAEFFAASWLAKNYHKIPKFNKIEIFQSRYDNIRFMYDMILAEDHPVLLSILYQNVDDFNECSTADYNQTDALGRSALHLISSYGIKHPILDLMAFDNFYIVRDGYKLSEIKADEKYEEMLHKLLESKCCDLFKNDEAMNMNAIEYADCALALRTLELFAKHKPFNLLNSRNYKNPLLILYYASVLGYTNLFRMVSRKVPVEMLRMKEERSGKSFLHLAAENGHLDIVNIIREHNFANSSCNRGFDDDDYIIRGYESFLDNILIDISHMFKHSQ